MDDKNKNVTELVLYFLINLYILPFTVIKLIIITLYYFTFLIFDREFRTAGYRLVKKEITQDKFQEISDRLVNSEFSKSFMAFNSKLYNSLIISTFVYVLIYFFQ